MENLTSVTLATVMASAGVWCIVQPGFGVTLAGCLLFTFGLIGLIDRL